MGQLIVINIGVNSSALAPFDFGTGDGAISASDLASLMAAVGRKPAEEELKAMINKANPEINGNDIINCDDFFGAHGAGRVQRHAVSKSYFFWN